MNFFKHIETQKPEIHIEKKIDGEPLQLESLQQCKSYFDDLFSSSFEPNSSQKLDQSDTGALKESPKCNIEADGCPDEYIQYTGKLNDGENRETEDGDHTDTPETENDKDDAGDEREADYSAYLEKGDDGKYYDKETGRSYDSVEEWVKDQERYSKALDTYAKTVRQKADKEYARYKNSEENGETADEKQAHYLKSQELYKKADECEKKAEHIREKISGKDVNETKKGGSYRDVLVPGEGDKYEVHHMPADSASHLERGDGPAIKMDKEDHRQTASCGMSREAREYREAQKELIAAGKFREALQMDIDDIHEKFGDKYDDAINEMLDYIDKLEEEGKI